MAIKLIIGLRNPGTAYEQTRHNAGGWFAISLARQHGMPFKPDKKMHAEIANLELPGSQCKIALPITFMNQSGLTARALSQFYRIQPSEILAVHDDLDLPVGRVKLKQGGGHGGHNGLRDIITQLGTNEFFRLRLGIGHPGHKDLVHQFVLSKPSKQDQQSIFDAIDRGVAAMPLVLSGDIAKAMSQLNA